MSIKTKKIRSHRKTYKRHNKRHTKRHTKRRRIYRKRRDILTVPGSQGLPLFSAPIPYKSHKIRLNENPRESGNMIKGLRNM